MDVKIPVINITPPAAITEFEHDYFKATILTIPSGIEIDFMCLDVMLRTSFAFISSIS
jgi:hypothetical protein